MSHEKIFRMDDGGRIKVRVKFKYNGGEEGPKWIVDYYGCPFRHRKWEYLGRISDSFGGNYYPDGITEENVISVMQEYWDPMRPTNLETLLVI